MSVENRRARPLHAQDVGTREFRRSAGASTAAATREQLKRRAVEPHDTRLHLHLRAILGGLREENLHATFLGSGSRYLDDAIIARGTTTGVAWSARSLVARALELDAGGVILAHNHPSGSCEPSTHDIEATHRIAELLLPLEVSLVDHLVVGSHAITSMRIAGYLDV